MKRILLALFLVATMLLAMSVSVVAADEAPAGKYKGTYVASTFADSTGVTVNGGATVADGILTVPAATANADNTVDFVDVTIPDSKTVYVSFVVKATEDMNFNAQMWLTTDKGKIYLQFNAGNLASWATGNALCAVGSKLNDGEWHEVEMKYTFGENWEISVAVDGGEAKVMNPTALAASGFSDPIKKQYTDAMVASTVIGSFNIRSVGNAAGKGSVSVDNFNIGDGTLNVADNTGDESENNGDTADMTVSLVVSAVALLGTAVVISKKRSK